MMPRFGSALGLGKRKQNSTAGDRRGDAAAFGTNNPSSQYGSAAEDRELQMALEASELEAALAESHRQHHNTPYTPQPPTPHGNGPSFSPSQGVASHNRGPSQDDAAFAAAISASLGETYNHSGASASGRSSVSRHTEFLDRVNGTSPSQHSSSEDERLAKMLQQAEIDHMRARKYNAQHNNQSSTRQYPAASPSTYSSQPSPTHNHNQNSSSYQYPPAIGYPANPSLLPNNPSYSSHRPSQVTSVSHPSAVQSNAKNQPQNGSLPTTPTGNVILPGPRNTQGPPPTSWDPYADVPDSYYANSCRQRFNLWGGLFPSGSRFEALGRQWHVDCFRCTHCKQPLGHGTFAVGDNGEPYHSACHKQCFHPQCCVCRDFIPAKDGRIWAMQLPFWRTKFCPAHAEDGTPKCAGCARMQPNGQVWVEVQKGRHLCLDCLDSVVVDTQDAQPLYNKVLDFYRGHGLLLPDRPPLLLVDSAALGDAEKAEVRAEQHASSSSHHNHRHQPGAAVFHTLGLTLLQEYQAMRTVVRPRQRTGSDGRASPIWHTIPEVVSIPTGSPQCEVTGILVLFGLPWLLTGSILAHEVMHAWLRTSGYRNLPPEVEEGMCQLMALLWLESLPAEAEGTWGERLASFCANHIRTDASPIYGDGFRAALECFQRTGLRPLLDHVQQTGRFPLDL
ncbi:hypothetical protein WJX73_001972 [Symbiochloris irregularis]|uniref:LIM zinc-binding domain-containing protein n=1 Tax=Symbiochloris irregularis TaxID=706552 RepID=A0AAW1NLI9_9CHLO